MSETLPPWNAPRAFPVLGLAPDAWQGPRRAAISGGSGMDGLRYDSHAYHLPGHRFPSVVINVGIRSDVPGAISGDVALCWLLRAPERPAAEEPVSTTKEPIEVDGGIAVAECASWPDSRLSFVRFDWRVDRQVSIATWDHPMTPAFFRSLIVY